MRSRLRRAVASSSEGDVLGEAGGGEEPPERVGGQLAGVEEPIDGPVQGELGRRPGEGEEDRVGIAPDATDDGAGGHEGSHHGSLSGDHEGRRYAGSPGTIVPRGGPGQPAGKQERSSRRRGSRRWGRSAEAVARAGCRRTPGRRRSAGDGRRSCCWWPMSLRSVVVANDRRRVVPGEGGSAGSPRSEGFLVSGDTLR